MAVGRTRYRLSRKTTRKRTIEPIAASCKAVRTYFLLGGLYARFCVKPTILRVMFALGDGGSRVYGIQPEAVSSLDAPHIQGVWLFKMLS